MYLIYKHTNTVSNKAYIGFTSKSINDRFIEHIKESLKDSDTNRAFHLAILKYPLEVWHSEILAQTESLEDAKNIEVNLIQEHKTHFKDGGYNMTIGGDGFVGGCHSSDSKLQTSLKLRKSKNYINGRKGKKLSDDHLVRLKQKRPHYKKITEEQFYFIKNNLDKKSYSELATHLRTDIKTIKRWASRNDFKNKVRDSKHLRSLTKSQYDYIQSNKNTMSLKNISQELSLRYDLVKKWSGMDW